MGRFVCVSDTPSAGPRATHFNESNASNENRPASDPIAGTPGYLASSGTAPEDSGLARVQCNAFRIPATQSPQADSLHPNRPPIPRPAPPTPSPAPAPSGVCSPPGQLDVRIAKQQEALGDVLKRDLGPISFRAQLSSRTPCLRSWKRAVQVSCATNLVKDGRFFVGVPPLGDSFAFAHPNAPWRTPPAGGRVAPP